MVYRNKSREKTESTGIARASSLILTRKEIEVINKKLLGKKLSQQDSNYLSRYVRPKLREISSIDAKTLLGKLQYSQKSISIENRIKTIILKCLENVSAVILYGSAIQNNYSDYNDIDILIVIKSKIFRNLGDKAKKTKELKKELDKSGINSDIEIYDKKTIKNACLHNPSLIYQLKDHKVIYGQLKLPDKKKEVYNIDLKMKLDWSDIEDIEPEGIDIYKALRNIILVRLILNKIVDNNKLKESLNDEIGKNLIEKLKNNKESKIEKRLALNYLKELSEITRKEIKGGLWEKIEL
jgi:predicted nucleotidyltransferase